MSATSEEHWDAIYRIGTEDGTADKIQPAVIAKLTELKMAGLSATGLPQLSPYGAKICKLRKSEKRYLYAAGAGSPVSRYAVRG